MDSKRKEGKGREKISNPDPFGSYTGRTGDPKEKPVQDSDDL